MDSLGGKGILMTGQGKKGVSEQGRIIAENMRALRKFAGLTLQDVGHILGISHQQVQKYESGANRLPLQLLPALCDAYGVKMEAFLHGTESAGINAESADLQHLQHSFGRIANAGMRRKILQVIDILAA